MSGWAWVRSNALGMHRSTAQRRDRIQRAGNVLGGQVGRGPTAASPAPKCGVTWPGGNVLHGLPRSDHPRRQRWRSWRCWSTPKIHTSASPTR